MVIVLRAPTNTKKDVAVAFGDYLGNLDRTHENRIRAEQLLLLSKHPACPQEKLPAVPPQNPSSSSKWAEPGWQLNLEVSTKNKSNANKILPIPPSNKIFNALHSEICSGTGHQIAALVGTHHLRGLAVEE